MAILNFQKGTRRHMSVFEALTLMFAFGTFLLMLLEYTDKLKCNKKVRQKQNIF
ncbi:putative holin-like toxin [Ligilactobacillus equi]